MTDAFTLIDQGQLIRVMAGESTNKVILKRNILKLAISLLYLLATILMAACQPGIPVTSSAPSGLGSIYESASITAAQPADSGGQGVRASLKLREETPIPRPVSESHPFEIELVGLINAEREKAGLEPLALSRPLAAIARRHSQDMGEHAFFSHNSSAGLIFQERLKQAGYTYTAAAENIFAGSGPFNSPEAALKAWMNSTDHRNNLLNPTYTQIGVGYRYFPSSAYGGYFTAEFGAQ